MRKVDESKNDKLMESWNEHHNISQAARDADVSYGYACKYLEESGMHAPSKRKPRRQYELDADRIRSLMEDSKTLAEISRLLDVPDSVVRRFAIKHALYAPSQRPQRYRNVDMERAEKLYLSENKSLAEIADIFDVSEAIIQHLFSKRGIKKDASAVAEQRKKTMKEKYGYEHPIDDPDNRKKTFAARNAYHAKRRKEKEKEQEKASMSLTEYCNLEAALSEKDVKMQPEKHETTMSDATCTDDNVREIENSVASLHLDEHLNWREIKANCMPNATYGEILEELFNQGVSYIRSIDKFKGIDTEQMCRDYQDGTTQSELASRYHLTASSLHKYLANKNLVPAYGQQIVSKMSDGEVQDVIDMYNDGNGIYAIARVKNLDLNAIKYILSSNGICMRRTRLDVDYPALEQEYADGVKIKDLSRKYGISENQIRRHLDSRNMLVHRTKDPRWDDDRQFTDFVAEYTSKLGRKLTVNEIADFFSKATGVVYKKIRKLDLDKYITRSSSRAEDRWYKFGKKLDENATCENRTAIRPYEIDVYLPTYMLGMEVNPSSTHNVDLNIFTLGDSSMTSDYHLAKSLAAQRNEIHLIHIFDWDPIVKIEAYVTSLVNVSDCLLDVCDVRAPSEEIEAFIERYSMHVCSLSPFGTEPGAFAAIPNSRRTYVCGYRESDLSACMVVDEAHGGEYEIIDYCTAPIVNYRLAFKSLMDSFLSEHSHATISMNIRRAISSGDFAIEAGFDEIGETAPAFCWAKMNDKGEMILPDTPAYRVMIRDMPEGESVENFLNSRMYGRVYDCGTVRMSRSLS